MSLQNFMGLFQSNSNSMLFPADKRGDAQIFDQITFVAGSYSHSFTTPFATVDFYMHIFALRVSSDLALPTKLVFIDPIKKRTFFYVNLPNFKLDVNDFKSGSTRRGLHGELRTWPINCTHVVDSDSYCSLYCANINKHNRPVYVRWNARGLPPSLVHGPDWEPALAHGV